MQQGRLWREYRDGLTHQQAEGDGHEGGVPAEEVRPRHRRVQHEGRHRPRDQVEHHPDVRLRLIWRFSLPSVQDSIASLLSVECCRFLAAVAEFHWRLSSESAAGCWWPGQRKWPGQPGTSTSPANGSTTTRGGAGRGRGGGGVQKLLGAGAGPSAECTVQCCGGGVVCPCTAAALHSILHTAARPGAWRRVSARQSRAQLRCQPQPPR